MALLSSLIKHVLGKGVSKKNLALIKIFTKSVSYIGKKIFIL